MIHDRKQLEGIIIKATPSNWICCFLSFTFITMWVWRTWQNLVLFPGNKKMHRKILTPQILRAFHSGIFIFNILITFRSGRNKNKREFQL